MPCTSSVHGIIYIPTTSRLFVPRGTGEGLRSQTLFLPNNSAAKKLFTNAQYIFLYNKPHHLTKQTSNPLTTKTPALLNTDSYFTQTTTPFSTKTLHNKLQHHPPFPANQHQQKKTTPLIKHKNSFHVEQQPNTHQQHLSTKKKRQLKSRLFY